MDILFRYFFPLIRLVFHTYIFSAIIGKGFDITLEAKVICMTIPNLLVDALRNPIIARFAFRVNQAIQKETVEDRRQAVIRNALEKKDQRKKNHI